MNRNTEYNQRVFKGAMWLYNEHKNAESLVREKKADTSIYEYSRRKDKIYTGLVRYMDKVLSDPVWKEAYQLLIDYGMIEIDKDWDNPTHYRVIC